MYTPLSPPSASPLVQSMCPELSDSGHARRLAIVSAGRQCASSNTRMRFELFRQEVSLFINSFLHMSGAGVLRERCSKSGSNPLYLQKKMVSRRAWLPGHAASYICCSRRWISLVSQANNIGNDVKVRRSTDSRAFRNPDSSTMAVIVLLEGFCLRVMSLIFNFSSDIDRYRSHKTIL